MTPQEFIATWKKANLSERSAAQSHFLDLCDLLGQPKPAHADPKTLDVLRKLFTDPYALEPGETTEAITQDVAERFSGLAEGMRIRNVPAEKAAHFLMKLMFCMFAEDIELLPRQLFTNLLN